MIVQGDKSISKFRKLTISEKRVLDALNIGLSTQVEVRRHARLTMRGSYVVFERMRRSRLIVGFEELQITLKGKLILAGAGNGKTSS